MKKSDAGSSIMDKTRAAAALIGGHRASSVGTEDMKMDLFMALFHPQVPKEEVRRMRPSGRFR